MATRTCGCSVEDRPSYEIEARQIHFCPLHREAAALVRDFAGLMAPSEMFGDAGTGDPAAMVDLPALTALAGKARAILNGRPTPVTVGEVVALLSQYQADHGHGCDCLKCHEARALLRRVE